VGQEPLAAVRTAFTMAAAALTLRSRALTLRCLRSHPLPPIPMSQENHLIEILCALSDHQVDYVVAGGVAMVLHGVERMTLDLDVALSLEPGNLRRFLNVMTNLRLVPRAPVRAEIILDPNSVAALIREKNALVFTFWSPQEPYRQIDLFLTRENNFDDLASDAYLLSIRGRTVRVASRPKLIQMKSRVRPIREKDINDIRALTELEAKEGTDAGED
jgi:hypothetical protein